MSMLDTIWVLYCIGLIVMMQAGFICLESGQVRSINSISVAIKNIIDFCLMVIVFWAVGYAFMFGTSFNGLVGTQDFFYGDNATGSELLFFCFNLMFCGTAVTIISGSVAERMSLFGYLIIVTLVAGFIYPIFGHWAWSNGTVSEIGWLKQIGFYDFAGSSVVHSVGGWVALASILVIGPRIGRFTADGKAVRFIGTNIPISALGAFLLCAGWLGFNGGSELAVTDRLPRIFVNTIFAAAAGGMTNCIITWYRSGKPDSIAIINGLLGGLVAITASCSIVEPASALLIGAVAAVVTLWVNQLLENHQIDDVVGAVSVHLGAGIWGTLAVAIFGNPEGWNSGLDRMGQFGVQFLGVLVCGIYVFGVSYLLLKLVNNYYPLRVSREIEMTGLDFGLHNIKNSLVELMEEIGERERIGDTEHNIILGSNPETALIARSYNKILDRFNIEIDKRTVEEEKLKDAANLDALTGIPNRRYFDNQMDTEWKLGQRRREPLSLIMIDIDYFKKYNDAYGHQQGDTCLTDVAKAINSTLTRPTDFVARYGGEEFIVVLPI